MARAAHFGDERVQWESRPLAHGPEKVGLVLEMPVDRAPGDPGGRRDLGKGGVRNATLAKNPLGGIEQLFARDGGLCFRLAGHELTRRRSYKQSEEETIRA